MAMTITDLHLTDDEITSLQTALQTLGHPTAIETTITEQEQRVEDYSSRYSVPANTKKRLARILVLRELYTLAGQSNAAREKAYDEAMGELQAIRDGKMFLQPSSDITRVTGTWGSEDRYQDSDSD